jgi:hypothetical protein
MIGEPEHRWNIDDDPTTEDFAKASAERRALDHRRDVDTDRCRCGGMIVYFDDGDREGKSAKAAKSPTWCYRPGA